MILKPDCWVSSKYDKSFGPLGQWDALRKLKDGREITEKDAEWLANTSIGEVDGNMAELLREWKAENQSDVSPAVVATRDPISSVVNGLFSDLSSEIAAIKNGQLDESKAREIAKFRTMQLRTMELLLQAGHLEVKIRNRSDGS